MKKILSILFLAVMVGANAQVIIGDATGSAANTTSVLLDFAKDQNKGIVLPYVRRLPPEPTQGTIVLDATTANNARVKYYNGSWIDLSGQDANISGALSDQPEGEADSKARTIISTDGNSAVDGVLVLESTSRAMVLPQVTSVGDIPNPAPGMMVYINKNGAKRLAVFNGEKWSFWKRSTSTNGSAVASSNKCDGPSSGYLVINTISENVTQGITVTVTTPGTYSYSAVANGVTFSASGTFTATGDQTVVLNAYGTPVNAGSTEFRLDTSPSCTFTRSVNNPS